MKLTTTPLSDDEIDQLADFLTSLPSPQAMNIERLDGFFCALLIGPELVMPSEYWPHVVGSTAADAEAFATPEQAQEIMSLVIRHWNAINAKLRSGDIYLPILLLDDEGVSRGNEWAKGFMQGVDLRRSSWQVLIHDGQHGRSLLPVLALANENHPDPELRFESPPPEKREELLHLLTASIVQIYRYFEPERTGALPATQPFTRDAPKVGRNEPCPCGSGKKYKQCCLMRLH
jgi:uncharacterized protein